MRSLRTLDMTLTDPCVLHETPHSNLETLEIGLFETVGIDSLGTSQDATDERLGFFDG